MCHPQFKEHHVWSYIGDSCKQNEGKESRAQTRGSLVLLFPRNAPTPSLTFAHLLAGLWSKYVTMAIHVRRICPSCSVKKKDNWDPWASSGFACNPIFGRCPNQDSYRLAHPTPPDHRRKQPRRGFGDPAPGRLLVRAQGRAPLGLQQGGPVWEALCGWLPGRMIGQHPPTPSGMSLLQTKKDWFFFWDRFPCCFGFFPGCSVLKLAGAISRGSAWIDSLCTSASIGLTRQHPFQHPQHHELALLGWV